MTNREMLESALKRVNALAGTHGKLYYDSRYGYCIINVRKHGEELPFRFDESSRKSVELLAYLHGVEDALLSIRKNKED